MSVNRPNPPGTSEPGPAEPGIILPGSIPGALTGNGRGYCPDGFAISDTRAMLSHGASFSIWPLLFQLLPMYWFIPSGQTLPLWLNPYVGYKIGAESHGLIDPWTCNPMPVVVESGSGGLKYFYQSSRAAYLVDPISGAFVKAADLAAVGAIASSPFAPTFTVYTGHYVDPNTGSYLLSSGSFFAWSWAWEFWHGLGGDGGTAGIWYPPPGSTTGGPPPPLPAPLPPAITITAVNSSGPILQTTVSWDQSQGVPATNYRLLLYAADGTTLLAATPIITFAAPVPAGTDVVIPWDLRGPVAPGRPYAIPNSTSFKMVAVLYATTIGEQDTSAPFSFSTAWTPPAPATALTLTPLIPDGAVRADWANPGGVTGNRVYWRRSGTTIWNLVYDSVAVTTLTLKLPVGMALDVMVRTVNSNNVESTS